MTRFTTTARRRVRIGLAVAAGGLGVAFGVGWALAGAVGAQSGQALAVDVTGASNTLSPDGVTCDWTVSSNVTAVNLTADALTYSEVAASVSWTSATSSGVDTDVTISDPGTPALAAGDTLASGARQSYDGFTVQFAIPCAAVNGDLAIGITTQDGFGSGDNHFLGNGTPLPIGWVGALGLTVIAGLFLVLLTYRWRLSSVKRLRAAATSSSSGNAMGWPRSRPRT